MNIIETNLSFSNLSKRSKTTKIILHHTAVTVEQSIETIHNYHKNSLEYAGIGYHFYIRKDGTIYRGRPEDTIGAHAYGSNSDSIGICFEGNFDEETISEAQVRAGQELISYLKVRYGINTVKAHREVCNTSCPGSKFPFERMVNGVIEENIEGDEVEMKVYKNGSTIENVYADTNCTNKIGSLNPYESCDCFGIFENRAMVRYKVDGQNNYKIGFCKWLDGVK